MIKTRICGHCGASFEFEQRRGRPPKYCADHRDPYARDREAQLSQSKAWQLANRERYLANLARWRAEHPEYQATWRIANPGYSRALYAKHRTHLRAYNRRRYMLNPMRSQVRTGPFLSQHPLRGTLKARRQRFRLGGTRHRHRARFFGVEYQPIDRIAVFERDGWKCQICGRPTPRSLIGTQKPRAPELDHRVPMSRGGGHTYANVQTACHACNAWKGARHVVGQLPLMENPAP